MDYPKLRNLNVFPVQRSGQTYLCLQDPESLSEKALFLPVPVYFIVSFFDGEHSLVDIQAEFMRRYGEFLFSDKINEIVHQLDENLFLEGGRAQEVLREKEESFRKATVREAVFAGKSYGSDPQGLKRQIARYFEAPEGPGPIGERRGGEGLRGAVAPHIDFQRGGGCYAFAHRQVAEGNDARCFVILGTAHTPTQHPFCLTRKDFSTPLGTFQADLGLIDAIQSGCSQDLFIDEGIHRSEHSIEFQCVFLRYLYPEPTPLTVVPILCGSFHEAIERGVSPVDLPSIREFLDALKKAVASAQKKICCIASADLAHMGHQFGDREGMGGHRLRGLEEEDREMLGYAERLDGEGLFWSVSRERDRRKICGLPAIYTLLHVLPAREGRLLRYGQAFTAETESVVSFASMAFY